MEINGFNQNKIMVQFLTQNCFRDNVHQSKSLIMQDFSNFATYNAEFQFSLSIIRPQSSMFLRSYMTHIFTILCFVYFTWFFYREHVRWFFYFQEGSYPKLANQSNISFPGLFPVPVFTHLGLFPGLFQNFWPKSQLLSWVRH